MFDESDERPLGCVTIADPVQYGHANAVAMDVPPDDGAIQIETDDGRTNDRHKGTLACAWADFTSLHECVQR